MSRTRQQKAMQTISTKIETNIQSLQEVYADCSDVVFRSFKIGQSIDACIVYITGLIHTEEVDEHVLSPLLHQTNGDQDTDVKDVLSVPNIKALSTLDECVSHISAGNSILFINGHDQATSVFLSKTEHRAIEEPAAEEVVRGPREGFIEELSVNVSLLRKRIQTPQLKVVELKLGAQTHTKVVICYMDNIASEDIIQEVKSRLRKIHIDGIIDSQTIEELVIDDPYSPFPQILDTERPDTVCAQLLEGRVAILVDGTPFALIAPATFFSLFQANEDYYLNYLIATAVRWLRYIFLFISLLLPSLYIAVTTFHQEMIPTSLLLKIMTAREEVPFPVFIEVLMMEITFEALREAGLRLPRQIGSAVSIVGALVLGESAVSAGIVSAPVVIVVALTGIASFTIPKYNLSSAIRLLRFPLMVIAVFLGLLGVMLGIILLVIHLCSLRSFGKPYLEPIAPLKKNDLKDTAIRAPWWKLRRRPQVLGRKNITRQSVR